MSGQLNGDIILILTDSRLRHNFLTDSESSLLCINVGGLNSVLTFGDPEDTPGSPDGVKTGLGRSYTDFMWTLSRINPLEPISN